MSLTGGQPNLARCLAVSWVVRSFFGSLLQAGVRPTLDPSAETVERSNALAKLRGEELVDVCVHDMQGEEG